MSERWSTERANSIIRAFVRARGSAAGEDPSELARVLAHALPAHFAVEEEPGGLFDALAAAGETALVSSLRADHGEFRRMLQRASEAGLRREREMGDLLEKLGRLLAIHERSEAEAAARHRVPLPCDACEECPPVTGEVAAALEEVAARTVREVEAQPGRYLVAIRVGLPPGVPWEPCLSWLEQELARRGLDFVDVFAESTPDRPTLVEVVFEGSSDAV
jgi:hypothetical protein